MISINANKLRVTLEKLKKVRKKVSDDADKQYRQKVFYLYELAVRVSPQFSGNFAANWDIAVDGNMPVYKQIASKQNAGVRDIRMQPHIAGDPEAVNTALGRGRARLAGVTIRSKVHLVNATDLYTDGTRMIGPDGPVNLRPENIIPGNLRIESYVRARAKEK